MDKMSKPEPLMKTMKRWELWNGDESSNKLLNRPGVGMLTIIMTGNGEYDLATFPQKCLGKRIGLYF